MKNEVITTTTFFHIRSITEENGCFVFDLEGLHQDLTYEILLLLKNAPEDREFVYQENYLVLRRKNEMSDNLLKTIYNKYCDNMNFHAKMKDEIKIRYCMFQSGDVTKADKQPLRMIGKMGWELIDFYLFIDPQKKLISLDLRVPGEAEKFLSHMIVNEK